MSLPLIQFHANSVSARHTVVHRIFRFCLLILALGAGAVRADWVLDAERSHIAFISTKNGNVAEVHHFGGLSGSIDAEGNAEVRIALDAVETAIPIRNERMREMLFDTAAFPEAVIRTSVSADVLAAASAEGSVAKQRVSVTLHGSESAYDTALLLNQSPAGTLSVSTRQPLVIDAASFDLGEGVEALRKIAGLAAISTAVPVTAHLVFRPES